MSEEWMNIDWWSIVFDVAKLIDLESGGGHCGVVQISAKIFRIMVDTNEVSREASYFN